MTPLLSEQEKKTHPRNCIFQKMPTRNSGRCIIYYRSNDSEEEQKLKKKLQKIADENKIAWKGW